MESKETISLLQKCNLGTKMAVSSIDDVMDKLHDEKLKELLQKSREHHEKLGDELHKLLLQHHSDDQDPGVMAKSMSWFKTNIKVGMGDDSDKAAADLMTDGCNMGIKTLYQYLNQYKDADHTAKAICSRLISIEETLLNDLRKYL